jgi:3-hydroxybutyryl-CoA dehydrogenase
VAAIDKNRAKLKSRPPAGVVGMGLMGTSIAACLVAAGHRVGCVETDSAKVRTAPKRLLRLLEDSSHEGFLAEAPSTALDRVTISGDFSVLADAAVIIESTVEDLVVKQNVIADVENVVSVRALIGSNTSAIPVSELQREAKHPERILGLHWAEPANITRFMEVICGARTAPVYATRAMQLARSWGKEPSLLRKDIRGFITNRIMYAMLREAFHLVEAGYASVEDVDRSLRNDMGYWITFAGPFRFMDLTGIPAYAAVMKDLLPDLDSSTQIPRLMQKMVRSGARGVSNAKGFYRYTPAQAKRWEELFLEFSHQIRRLAEQYPDHAGNRSAKRGRARSADRNEFRRATVREH